MDENTVNPEAEVEMPAVEMNDEVVEEAPAVEAEAEVEAPAEEEAAA